MTIYMTHAIDENGIVKSVDSVESGLACNCTCIECGQPLIAAKGDKYVHHFRHESEDKKCNWSGESELHYLAKHILKEDMKLYIPNISWNGFEQSYRLHFSDVQVEKGIGPYKADLIATTDSFDTVAIEISVTHPCDENKIRYFNNNLINAIQININPEPLYNKTSIDIDFVRKEIAKSNFELLSLNPTSSIASNLIAKANNEIRDLNIEYRKLNSQKNILTTEVETLKNEHDELDLRTDEVRNELRHLELVVESRTATETTIEMLEGLDNEYSRRERQYIRQHNQAKAELVRDFKNALKDFDKMRATAQERLIDIRKKASDIYSEISAMRSKAQHEIELARKLQDRVIESELRLAKLKELVTYFESNEQIVTVEQITQRLEELYSNRYHDLKETWERYSLWDRNAVRPEVLNKPHSSHPDLTMITK
ncbi:hypothetical protein ACSTJQ_12885 [Vibrio parahaemolyticus]